IGEDTDPHAMFSAVASVLTLSDGSIVVADGQARELRRFDSAGNWVQTRGRHGEGPGEFNSLDALAADQWDTLWVVDETLGRLSVLHPDTGLVRTITLPPDAPWAASPIHRLNSGRWLFRAERPSTGSPPLGVWRDTQLVVVTTPTIDSTIDTVGTFAGSERIMLEIDVQGRGVRTMAGRPYGLVGSIVSDGERIAVATGEEWKVDVLGQDGSVLMSVRRAEPPVEVEAGETEKMIQQCVQRMIPLFGPGLEAALREAPARETTPAYGSVYYGTDGHLWVVPYQPMSGLPKNVSVFDRDGSWLGEVAFPASFTVEEIGAD